MAPTVVQDVYFSRVEPSQPKQGVRGTWLGDPVKFDSGSGPRGLAGGVPTEPEGSLSRCSARFVLGVASYLVRF